MKSLPDEWFTQGLLDFEYKKYLLLAWMQQVDEEFSQCRLYPPLADLSRHHQNLTRFLEDKAQLERAFPKEVTEADFEQLELRYRYLTDSREEIDILQQVAAFALPELSHRLDRGRQAYHEVEQQLVVAPIGLLPLHRDEGLVLLHTTQASAVEVYRYRLSIFESATDVYRGISLTLRGTETYSIGNTFEQIKWTATRRERDLPTPATYLLEARKPLPREQTLLPIAKRMLVRYILTDQP